MVRDELNDLRTSFVYSVMAESGHALGKHAPEKMPASDPLMA